MKAAWLCAVGLLVANGLGAVRADDSVLPLCPPPDLATLPENPGAEPARRLATLATWEEKGAAAQDMLRLGALYRLGRAHPAALVDAVASLVAASRGACHSRVLLLHFFLLGFWVLSLVMP